MAKNTKAKSVKTDKVKKHWFESRNHGKSIITAIRNPEDKPGKAIVSKPEVKPLKEGGIMECVQKILSKSGRITIDVAIKKLLKTGKVNSKNPEARARTVFMQASKYRVPVKIEKIGEVIFIELA